jgi:hypothetical protein
MFTSETDNDSLHDLSDPETQRQVIRTISINDHFRSQSKEAKEFLKNMDKDLSKIRNSRRERNSLDEVVSLLTSQRIRYQDLLLYSYTRNIINGASMPTMITTTIIVCQLILQSIQFIDVCFFGNG